MKTLYTIRHWTWDQFIWTILCKVTGQHRMVVDCEDMFGQYLTCHICDFTVTTRTTANEKSSLWDKFKNGVLSHFL